MRKLRATGTDPLRLLLGAFLLLVVAGTLLLKLPWATPARAPISWIDALFTSTSATCVTGLAVRDTGAGFTGFGQVVILGLIQLGGLGIMTFGLFVFVLIRGKISMAHRSVLEQTLSGGGGQTGGEILPLLRLVFRYTLLCEAAGRDPPPSPLLVGPRLAFGGSGTRSSTRSRRSATPASPSGRDSLSRYRADPLVNAAVIVLIVLGGLGFLVVYDLTAAGREGRPGRVRHLSVHTKLVLAVSRGALRRGRSSASGSWKRNWRSPACRVGRAGRSRACSRASPPAPPASTPSTSPALWRRRRIF